VVRRTPAGHTGDERDGSNHEHDDADRRWPAHPRGVAEGDPRRILTARSQVPSLMNVITSLLPGTDRRSAIAIPAPMHGAVRAYLLPSRWDASASRTSVCAPARTGRLCPHALEVQLRCG
jgi:hypothetical protein